MQPASDQGKVRTSQLRRYGPLAVIVVLVLVVGGIAVAGGGDDDGEDGGEDEAGGQSQVSTEIDWASIEGSEPGAPAPVGDMPLTYAEAEEDGAVDDYEWPDSCDTELGTVAMPSVYALPCVPAFEGDNGGATSTGVTADSIKVVYYAPEQSADIESILAGLGANDSAEQRSQTLEDYVEIFESMSETYGRRIELVRFEASGATNDVVAATADATDIIAMEPFAVLGGPGLDRGTFAQTLAEAGVPCFECGAYLPDRMVRDMAPYVWSSQPSPDQLIALLATWTAAGAASAEGDADVATFAGGELEGEPRKIGVIHFEQDPPIYGDTEEQQEEQFGTVEFIESYVLDLATLPAKATELIAKYKAEGVNSIVFLGDPFMPGYLTRAATEQDYFPEWIFTGTVLTDTNVLARSWDPAQMEHAYGISLLAAPTDQDLQEALALYRWYFGGEDTIPPAPNQYALLAPPAGWLFAGIHMAGPELTPETFARGLFRIPPRGGGPSNPQVSYGNWGFFPEIDYQGIDDAVEIWWDPTVEAEDERGTMGSGVWRRSNEGERFTAREAPPPKPFTDPDSTLTVVEELAPEDTPPEYPPPPGSPAAAG